MPHALVTFLHARLDEDEAAARACAGNGEWKASDIAIYGADLAPEVREHMALHDPARVLAEVESKRRAIGRISSHAAVMGLDEVHGDLLRSLALPYAGHPDYREEWRP